MVCVQCGQKTDVINSRPQRRTNQVWRRRACQSCGAVFSTQETADYSGAWVVLGASKHPAPFSRDRLFLSLYDSCRHRTTALRDAAALADTVISKLQPHIKDGALAREYIVTTAQVALTRFDPVAGMHYAAYHRDSGS
jgi:transcriptional repressor NrdR